MAHASLKLCMQSEDALKALEGQKNSHVQKEHASALRRASREALAHAKSSTVLAKWMGDKVQLGIALTFLSQAHIVGGHLKEALKAATEAEEIYQELGYETEQAHVLVIMAEVLAHLKKNEEAVDTATRALELSRAVQDWMVEDRAITVIDSIKGKQQAAAAAPQQDAVQFQIEAQPNAAESVQAPAKKGLDPAWVKDIVNKTVLASLAADEDEVHEDSPLMETGMDSLTSVSFRNGLNQQLGMNLPAALMFDYPSQRAIVDHVIEVSQG